MAQIGFIGLGSMGRPMAEHLVRAGHDVVVWNRSRDKAQPLAALGARVADSLGEAVPPEGIVISMLADDAALEHVCRPQHGILARLGGGLHVSMSTVRPETARTLAEAHADAGARYLAAPVFGRPDMAEAGKLIVCLSGAAADKEAAKPVLQAFAGGFYDYGETDVAASNVVKLAGNFMLAAAMEAMGEAYTFAEHQGIDREQLNGMLTETLFACPAYANYGTPIAKHNYEPAGFKLNLGLKDLRLVRHAADANGVPMPLADLVFRRLETLNAQGHGHIDWAGIGRGASDDAGD